MLKILEKSKYLAITVIALAVVVCVAWGVRAYNDSQNVNVTGDYNYYEAIPEAESTNFGAIVGPDVYERWYFYDGIIAETGINIPIGHTATTTAANPAPAGYWCNDTNQDLVADGNWYFDLETANTGWGSNWTITTTTLNDGKYVWTPGTNSFSATSSNATLMPTTAITTSTTGFYDRDTRTLLGAWYDDGGNATTTPFNIDKGVCVVIHSDFSGATSTDSWTTGGGESGYVSPVGKVHLPVSIR